MQGKLGMKMYDYAHWNTENTWVILHENDDRRLIIDNWLCKHLEDVKSAPAFITKPRLQEVKNKILSII